MRVDLPQPIKLTNGEQRIAAKIRFDLNPSDDREEINASCEQAYDLMFSLVRRGAIPKGSLGVFFELASTTTLAPGNRDSMSSGKMG